MTEEKQDEGSKGMNRDSWLVYGLAIVLIMGSFFLAYQFVEPAPPKKMTIATGSKTGAYFAYAKKYKGILAKNGITLEILNTQGSLENLSLLEEGKVDLAFVQSGTGLGRGLDEDGQPTLVSLGSIYFEPLWVFSLKKAAINQLNLLTGKRIAAGSEGSGTWAVAKVLLERNGISDKNSKILPLASTDAVKGLVNGKVDAVIMVGSPQSTVIQDLLTNDDVSVMSFDRADAYTRHHRFLSSVTLPEGVVSLSRNLPTRDVKLLAAAATITARDGLHPALLTLIAGAAEEIHGSGGVFEEPGEFPSEKYTDFPMSDVASRYYRDGPPFLQRYLPFWAAVLIDQLKVMIVPLIALVLPLTKILPPTYRWRVRSRIYRMYKDLRVIESEIPTDGIDQEKADELLDRLNTIRKDLMCQSVPLSYADEQYQLRMHINLVETIIRERLS